MSDPNPSKTRSNASKKPRLTWVDRLFQLFFYLMAAIASLLAWIGNRKRDR